MSYPVYLRQRSWLLEKFHPSSAGCHILPHSYPAAVFTYSFCSSGSKPSGLNISSHGIHQSSWIRTSSHTCVDFKDQQWWQAFRYIFRNPDCSSSRMHLSRDGAPVGRTVNQISGLWSAPESLRHINRLELEAIRLALLQWGHQWRHQSVRVYCNNSTAVAYRRKLGEHILSPYFTKPWNCSISWISLW